MGMGMDDWVQTWLGAKFKPSQARDSSGRWTSGSGGATGSQVIHDLENQFSSQPIEHAALIKDGKVVLQKSGGVSEVTFTDSEVSKLNGATLIHNHPSGNSFSDSDIKFVDTAKLSEIRAVTPDYVYVMHPDENFHKFGWSVLSGSIGANRETLTKEMYAKIDAGKLSVDEANSQFAHELWTRQQEIFKTKWDIDLGYRRERRK